MLLESEKMPCILSQRFAAVIMRIREPKTTALVFASGKMVCTGAKSEEHSKLAARKVKATSDTVSLLHMLSNAGPIYILRRQKLLIDPVLSLLMNFAIEQFLPVVVIS
jgi:hypothetical protein